MNIRKLRDGPFIKHDRKIEKMDKKRKNEIRKRNGKELKLQKRKKPESILKHLVVVPE